MTQSLDEFAVKVQRMVEAAGRTLTKPDDDWMHVAFAQKPDGRFAPPLGLDFDAVSKDQAVSLVKEYVRSTGATRYALLISSWRADDPGRALDPDVHFRDLPGASEMLMLTVGDAETETVWSADIIRHPEKPPSLGPWAKTRYEGLFTNLAAALREVR